MKVFASLDDLPMNGARRWLHEGVPIAIFRCQDDRVFAIEDRCPHKGGPLSEGMVMGTQVSCPLHNWVIDLASGEAVAPDQGCVKRYSCEVRDGLVLVDV